MKKTNKTPIQFEVPENTHEEVVESFKANLLHILSKGVYTEAKYLKPAEAAAHMNLSRQTIYKMMKTGVLKSRKVMGSRLIAREDIDQLLSV